MSASERQAHQERRMSAADIVLLKNAAYSLECVAHLQQRERELLPLADGLRALVKRFEVQL